MMILVPKRNKDISQELMTNPMRQMEQMQRRMMRMFPSLLGDEDMLEGGWLPPVDVHDQKDRVIVRAELPGVRKEDLEVTVEKDNLIIKGQKRQTSEAKEGEYMRTEAYYGSFSRSFNLPAEVDAKSIQAQFRDGVLEIELPKKEEEVSQHKIDVM